MTEQLASAEQLELDPLDPRPRVVPGDGGWVLAGFVCEECGYRLALRRPWCPVCRGPLSQQRYGPGGTVWAGTVIRVPVADREPPIAIAYVDLDEGPRVLFHVELPAPEAGPATPGSRVEVAGVTERGDPLVRCVT